MAKKPKENEDRVSVTHEPHPLACKLTIEDRAYAAGQLAEAIQSLEVLDVERKTAMKEFGTRAAQLARQVRILSKQVKDGEAVRSVDCELRLNYTKLTATLVRTDTGEITEERPMTEDEKQMDLDFTDGKAKKTMQQTVEETEDD